MTRTAAAKATAAAEAVLAWLREQPPPVFPARRGAPVAPEASAKDAPPRADAAGHPPEAASAGGVIAGPPAAVSAPETPAPTGDAVASEPRPATTPGTGLANIGGAPLGVPLRLAHTDWLYHRLAITGPAAALAAFRAAASGAGVIPWQLDRDRIAEDFFHLLAAPSPPQQRSLSVAGARILAGQLRDAVARRHDLAVTRVGHSRACPFDLHALVPVPEDILRRGPDDFFSVEWLWQHWGTTRELRHVADATVVAGEVRRRPSRAGTAEMHLRFWSADWSPWRALTQIAAWWPALRFDLCPEYDPP
jgi:hypothetical protein